MSSGNGSNLAGVSILPCNRGMVNGPLGLHHYSLSPGAARAVCIYCGQLGPGTIFETTLDSKSSS